MDIKPDHWSVQITVDEKEWLNGLMEQLACHTLNYESVRIALDLAFKKGKHSAWKN